MSPPDGGPAVAVIGMAGRFPGADSVDAFWDQICRAEEGVRRLTPDELEAGGVPSSVYARPGYVPARGVLRGADLFDPGFFGLAPRDAVLLDPQHRVFLQTAHAALEDAGHDPTRDRRPVGVFAGAAANTYYHRVLASRPDLTTAAGDLAVLLANDKDFLTTRVSYLLDATGPSLAVQTACSTSLVAVCAACQSLAVYQCDVALAGGVAVRVPLTAGYHHARGGILSPDGHCRPYDADAAGTVPGDGVGVVVLKRLADALADRDQVRAVVRGWAVNNDGARKAGYTAPSMDQQEEVIRLAVAVAGVDPDTIELVEGHGTATGLGDAVELAALDRVLGAGRAGVCAVGSVKGNIGHLDAAAGVAGLIKAVFAVERGTIPPSLHFRRFHPEVRGRSRFFVPTAERPWNPPHPRRAGVSSFGMGGTNAHVVIEQPPAMPARQAAGPWKFRLSALTEPALATAISRLAEHLRRSPDIDMAGVAHTLLTGRRPLPLAREFVCRDRDEAIRILTTPAHPEPLPTTAVTDPTSRKVRLPTYPFEQVRVWADPVPEAAGPPAPVGGSADWLYAPIWKPCPQPWSGDPPAGRYLVFLDPTGFGAAVCDALRGEGRVVQVVEPGERFVSAGDRFRIRPADQADYDALAAEVRSTSQPLRVVYGWGAGGPGAGSPADRLVLGPIRLARALGADPDAAAHILLLTAGLDDLIGGDRIEPSASLAVGPCRVIPQEYPHLRCRLADVRTADPDRPAAAARAAAEFARFAQPAAGEEVVAIRGGRRWVQRVEPVVLRHRPDPVRDGGVVLITGGLGGIGRVTAGWLARRHKSRLALIGRSARPDDPFVAELEAVGAEVLVLAADVADSSAAARCIRDVVARWGPIHGLVHAAGVPAEGLIATRTPEGIAAVLRPKVEGTLALWEALGRAPDWTVLCSSLGLLTGGVTGVDYCAANAFLDGFAAAHARERVVAVAWDAWADVGMGARPLAEPLRRVREAAAAHALSPANGVEVFARILADPLPRVYVSTRDLTDPRTRGGLLGGIGSRDELLRLARPGSDCPTGPPPNAPTAGGTEAVLASIWEGVLGRAVGPDDNFFDLGGHSLLALEVLNGVARAFQVALPVSAVFDAPTVRTLGVRVDAARAAGGGRA